ncbi:hypothetical protein SISSUDRAFT_1029611 [Sistotremastrum suecicum HHB10207 ss-3]|uniref:Uncharacterized protein n=1 Tax=Sistotremastrum suecicum HHB10207 ss-3 TaxID=1314776 RepID=A0A166IMB2_9AGAM|nr:hypothetical protein SISSUDRAFT_1029611 [Sistotremastrum suecicum HHB10207 ss-3]
MKFTKASTVVFASLAIGSGSLAAPTASPTPDSPQFNNVEASPRLVQSPQPRTINIMPAVRAAGRRRALYRRSSKRELVEGLLDPLLQPLGKAVPALQPVITNAEGVIDSLPIKARQNAPAPPAAPAAPVGLGFVTGAASSVPSTVEGVASTLPIPTLPVSLPGLPIDPTSVVAGAAGSLPLGSLPIPAALPTSLLPPSIAGIAGIARQATDAPSSPTSSASAANLPLMPASLIPVPSVVGALPASAVTSMLPPGGAVPTGIIPGDMPTLLAGRDDVEADSSTVSPSETSTSTTVEATATATATSSDATSTATDTDTDAPTSTSASDEATQTPYEDFAAGAPSLPVIGVIPPIAAPALPTGVLSGLPLPAGLPAVPGLPTGALPALPADPTGALPALPTNVLPLSALPTGALPINALPIIGGNSPASN